MGSITELLTEPELKLLRAGYDPAKMLEDVREKLEAAWPDATPLVESVLGGFYVPVTGRKYRMKPANRERVVLALLANGGGQPFDVSVHFYWGLMEGLTVQELCDVLLLTASYGGVARYTDNFKLLGYTLALLKRMAAKGQPVPCKEVANTIAAAFPASGVALPG